jgi:hypothetical protein
MQCGIAHFSAKEPKSGRSRTACWLRVARPGRARAGGAAAAAGAGRAVGRAVVLAETEPQRSSKRHAVAATRLRVRTLSSANSSGAVVSGISCDSSFCAPPYDLRRGYCEWHAELTRAPVHSWRRADTNFCSRVLCGRSGTRHRRHRRIQASRSTSQCTM